MKSAHQLRTNDKNFAYAPLIKCKYAHMLACLGPQELRLNCFVAKSNKGEIRQVCLTAACLSLSGHGYGCAA
jgi:hypothetical protein